VHSSSAHVHALTDILSSDTVKSRLADTKYARDAATMDRFGELLRLDDGRAWYGPRECERAAERGAIGPGGGVLLVSNALFRSDDLAVRKRYVRLVEAVRKLGGDVLVMSSVHESGKRLDGLGGIAAILTFPMVGLDDDDDENEDAEGGDGGGGTGEAL
jgi:protein pelota